MNYRKQYEAQGFVSGIDILSTEETTHHVQALENAEAHIGNLHYLAKVHTILTSPHRLAVHSKVLDIVEQLLGPDILLYNVSYIIKEPRSEAYVSWHQDLTYWGLNSDEQVSMWLALTTADRTTGCMRMIPGSHRQGRLRHEIHPEDQTNVLLQSQAVPDVDEEQAVYCELQPGQASFHHGWVLHASTPNTGRHRRIGLNVQYIAPHVRQTKKTGYTALLVRGSDHFGHYPPDVPATTDLDPAALEARNRIEVLHRDIAGTS